MDGRRWWTASLAAATVLAVALRLPLLTQPMTADEGGYAGVARGWARGARLYADVWVDRPQGLLVLYRFVDWLDGGHAVGIRLTAIVFGVGLVWATAWAVRGLAGAAAGGIAAILCAAVTSVPTLQGFAANGELLAGTFAALCVALAVGALRRPSWWRWVLAGVAGGVAVSLKQSGFDGLAAVGTWLVVVACLGPVRRVAAHRLVLVLAGAAVPVTAMAVHGAVTGWDRWVVAMGGYRLHVQSAVSDGDWENLVRTARIAAPLLGPVAALALVGIVLAPRAVSDAVGPRCRPSCSRSSGSTDSVGRQRRRATGRHVPPDGARAWIVPVAWLGFAVLAFFAGGGFWRHYWVQLGAPLAALAGIAVAHLVRAQPWRALCTAALVVPSIVATGWVTAAPRDEWIVRADDDWRSPLDARVAGWLRDNDVALDSVYVLCASAGLYGDVPIVPGYPYLWMVEVHDAPGAPSRLIRYLSDPRTAPGVIAQFQPAEECDASGQVQQVLDTDYRAVATIDQVQILERIAPT